MENERPHGLAAQKQGFGAIIMVLLFLMGREGVSRETGSEMECYLQMFYSQGTVPMTVKMAG